MQLTKQEGYALRVVMDLAVTEVASVKGIAQRQNIPAAYLAKIVQALARGGIVRTTRGPRGGVELARSPASITLRQVLEAAQGPIALSRCLLEPHHDCSINGVACPIRQITTRIQDLVIQELDAVTLADVAGQVPASIVQRWLGAS
jgi:Rrf2 family protein